MEERETVNPTREQEDIREMHVDLADKKALNNYDWILHPLSRTLV